MPKMCGTEYLPTDVPSQIICLHIRYLIDRPHKKPILLIATTMQEMHQNGPRFGSSEEPLFEGLVDFVDEDHIQAFADALAWEHHNDDDTGGNTPRHTNHLTLTLQSGTNLHRTSTGDSVEHSYAAVSDRSASAGLPRAPDLITSRSDWYPINSPTKSTKRKKASLKSTLNLSSFGSLRNEFRSSLTYTVLRWPLLILVLTWMAFLCNCYILVRAYVSLSEYFLTWVGERRKIRDRLRSTRLYTEWVETAQELDRFLNLDKWLANPKFSYYDYRSVKLTITRLRKSRLACEDEKLLAVLQGCLKKNFAGIENRQLYSHRYYGTKHLVSDYIDEVVACINQVSESTQIEVNVKRKFFKIVQKNYGKTALCLSGGACFAYTHFGIVKALLDNDLLPSIISGTSGGGIVAALACTRTDAELTKLITPKLASKITACEDPWWVWIPRWWKTGARFDSVAWARKANFFTRGSTTFLESYQRTGRQLNISTVPADPHSPVILCNSITSPNCIIWSSLLASLAVPGILNPVVLMMKTPHKEVEPFSLGNKWRDGSLRTDIPLDSLNTYYNVNFSIVSQVNPHILLFFFAPKGTVGRPVAIPRRVTKKEKYAYLRGGFVATALEQLFKLEITKWLQIIKTLDLLPHLLEQDWLNIWLQRFSGTITIWPRIKFKDFFYILSDPTEEQLGEMIIKGERCMFPSLLFVKHRLSIERAIENGRKVCRQQQKNVPGSQVDQTNPNHFEMSSVPSSKATEMFDAQLGVEVNAMTGADEDSDLSDEGIPLGASPKFDLVPGASTSLADDDEDDLDYLPSEEVDAEDEDEENSGSDSDSGSNSETGLDSEPEPVDSEYRRFQRGRGLLRSWFRRLSDGNKLTRRNTIF